MKTSLITTLSFLILTLATQPLLGISSNSEPVLDIIGNKVKSTLEYKLIPVLDGAGGFSTHLGTNGQCPLDVIQLSSPSERGDNLRLLPYDNYKIVKVSTDVNLRFPVKVSVKPCNEEPLWKVDSYDDPLIVTGGIEGHPGAETLLNWFKIEKAGNFSYGGVYNIVHCPSVCLSCPRRCNKIGVSSKDGVRRLALVGDDEPALNVLFFPSEESSRLLQAANAISRFFEAAEAISMTA
ncbi:hypothetical protein AB3S75_027551 [Citrus x aurantiifolia]